MLPYQKIKIYRARHPWAKHLHYARRRCKDTAHKAYKYYGGKGIKCLLIIGEVKYLWERDGASKMECPSLDRINSKDHYKFSNCRFIPLSNNCSKPHLRMLIRDQGEFEYDCR